MLRKIRIAFATVVLVLITLLFLGIGFEWWGFLAKLQFLPAALALNLAVVVAILAITLVFGRIYCSVICPMGIFQDLAAWIYRKFNKKHRYHFIKENKWLRYGVLVLTVVAIVAGVQVLVALIAPYSAYGRIVRAIVAPHSWQLVLVGAVTMIVVVSLACITGRAAWCNSICPVGTTLGLFSRFAIFKPVIDESKCVGCHGCEKKCKGGCIDSDTRKIDYSRCVDCFDCLENCKLGAIKYKPLWAKAPQKTDTSRRAFMTSTVLLGGALAAKAQEMKLDGGLAPVEDKKNPQRSTPLVPFGARSVDEFYSKCTACQLCVSACPNGVLRPSTDLKRLMQPEMGYDKGYCRPECKSCSDVCPSGAILPIGDAAEKLTMSIGRASVNLDLCVVKTQDVSCGNCARHCPVGAIRMVLSDPSDEKSRRVPAVIKDRCIGCGACENLCPSRPISAITVDGIQNHMYNKEEK